jgi:hypothetical protein
MLHIFRVFTVHIQVLLAADALCSSGKKGLYVKISWLHRKIHIAVTVENTKLRGNNCEIHVLVVIWRARLLVPKT